MENDAEDEDETSKDDGNTTTDPLQNVSMVNLPREEEASPSRRVRIAKVPKERECFTRYGETHISQIPSKQRAEESASRENAGDQGLLGSREGECVLFGLRCASTWDGQTRV